MKKLFLTLFLFFLITPAWATTWYIRTGGGTDTQCTGTTDANYPGSGTGQACAYSHNFYLTGWYYDHALSNGTMHMSGGDTVIFSVSGESFKQGYDAAWTGCNAAFPYDCQPRPWPSGTSGAHTKIYGYGGNTGATTINTYLWGTHSIPQVLFLGGGSYSGINPASYVDIKNLDLSDRFRCEKGGTNPPTACGLSDDWSLDGIQGKGNDHISLAYLNIHGVARYGIQAPSASNWTYDHVTVNNNGYGGLSFDDGTVSSALNLTGTFVMSHSSVTHSGCGETYPGLATIDCWGQSNARGGYGDGVAFPTVGGGTTIGAWTITDSILSWNVQDGFDGKHGVHTGDSLHSARNLYEGNGGQQLKMESPLTSENDFFIGDCNYFNGQSFTVSGFGTATGGGVGDLCRAAGNTFELGVSANEVHRITGATIYGIGDVGILVSGTDSTCNGSTKIYLRNSVALGGRQWGDDTANNASGGNDTASFFYSDAPGACAAVTIDEDYNQIFGWKQGAGAVTGAHSRYGDPLIVGPLSKGPTTYSNTANLFNSFYLSSTSPARFSVTGANTADESLTSGEVSDLTIDYNNYARGSNWDGGAVQFGSTATSAICGNNLIESGEECDDGNTTSGDGCSSTCTNENPISTPSGTFKGAISGGKLIITGGKLIVN